MQRGPKIKKPSISSVTSGLVAVLLIALVAAIGVTRFHTSHAEAGPSMYLTAATGAHAVGDTVAVTLRENSNGEAVNTVQASLNYDSAKLRYVNTVEGDSFPMSVADSISSGLIRVARANSDEAVTGDVAILTLNFKVIAPGTANLSLDRNYTALVSSGTGKDILQTAGVLQVALSGTASSSGGGGSTPGDPGNTGGSGTPDTSTPSGSGAPALVLNPKSGKLVKGDYLNVEVNVFTGKHAIVASEAVLNFPADKLEYAGVSESGLFPTAQRTNATAGSIDIIRGIAGGSKGLTGHEKLLTVSFKVLDDSGQPTISLGQASAAYDDGGTGDNILDLAASTGAIYGTTSDVVTTSNLPAGTTKPSRMADIEQKAVISPSQAVAITGTAALTTDNKGAQIAEVKGKVSLAPISDPNNTSGIIKVEYYLNTKLVAQITKPPYNYDLDTTKLRNGVYDLTIKTFYDNGTTSIKNDRLQVNNKVTLAYVMRHYGVSLSSFVATLLALALLAHKFIIPRSHRLAPRPVGVPPEPGDHLYGFKDPTTVEKKELFAADPTVVTPGSASSAAAAAVAVADKSAVAAKTPLQIVDIKPPAQVPTTGQKPAPAAPRAVAAHAAAVHEPAMRPDYMHRPIEGKVAPAAAQPAASVASAQPEVQTPAPTLTQPEPTPSPTPAQAVPEAPKSSDLASKSDQARTVASHAADLHGRLQPFTPGQIFKPVATEAEAPIKDLNSPNDALQSIQQVLPPSDSQPTQPQSASVDQAASVASTPVAVTTAADAVTAHDTSAKPGPTSA